MSGHSKWSQIKRKKGAADVKRGQLFTRLGRELTLAAREGGGDPDSNFTLRLAMDKARGANMPKENIERAVKRGTGEVEGGALDEIMYEGYGPGGVALLVQVLTDNRNRAASEIRHLFTRGGGNLGSANSVAWMFEKRGVVTIEAGSKNPDDLALEVIDAGADDVKVDGKLVETYSAPEKLRALRDELDKRKITYASAELAWIAKTPSPVSPEQALSTLKLMEELEEYDDVQKVYCNLDISDEVMAKFEGLKEAA